MLRAPFSDRFTLFGKGYRRHPCGSERQSMHNPALNFGERR
jgi:hypothetical protein